MEHFDWLHSLGYPLINFIIFIVVLAFVGRKPLAAMAKRRRDEYEALYQAAREAQLKAQAQLATLNARLQQLDAEVADIKRKAQLEAEAEAQLIVKRGEELAQHIRTEAARIAEGEVLRAKQLLREEVLAAVKEQVEEKVRQDLSNADHVKYARDKASKLKQIIAGA